MVCRLSAKPEGDSPQPAENIIGCGLKVQKVPPGKSVSVRFGEFVPSGRIYEMHEAFVTGALR